MKLHNESLSTKTRRVRIESSLLEPEPEARLVASQPISEARSARPEA